MPMGPDLPLVWAWPMTCSAMVKPVSAAAPASSTTPASWACSATALWTSGLSVRSSFFPRLATAPRPHLPVPVLSAIPSAPKLRRKPPCTVMAGRRRTIPNSAPTNFAYIPPFNEIAVSYDPSGDYHVPTTYEWNLTVERQLPSNILFRVGYVGSRSLHILETQYYNPGVPCSDPASAVPCNGKANVGLANLTVCEATGGTVASCHGNPNTSGALFKPNTFSSTVQADITDINASYHSLQTSVEKRMSRGFTLLANYTYSKSLDDLPFGEGVSGFDTGYSTLPFNAP